ncbi:MAG: sigma-70 family RNA polymerase sigma factor [Bacteroidetes bacterium]|nr:sigma-70 family RNA polymerase sigma factor [Bacteroidota bacterium]
MSAEESDVIRRAADGDTRAYGTLVDRYAPNAMTLAMRMLKDRRDAEEALQDAFVRAFRALPGFERRAKFSTWLYRIVYNVCATMLSRRGEKDEFVRPEEDGEDAAAAIPSDDALPDAAMESGEFTHFVQEEIRRMEGRYSAILTMFLLQEMSYEEIMEVTGLPVGTVKNRLFRARMLLRAAVLKRFPEHSHGVIQ